MSSERYLADFTPGPWFWHTSDSHRRLSSKFKDGVGDVACRAANMILIAYAPKLLSYVEKQAQDGCKEAMAIIEEMNKAGDVP